MKKQGIISFEGLESLMDRKKGVIQVLTPFFDEFQLDISEEEIYAFFEEREKNILLNGLIHSQDVFRMIMAAFRERLGLNFTDHELELLNNSVLKWPLFEDTIKAMNILKEKYSLALITHMNPSYIHDLENRFGFRFDIKFFSSEECRGESFQNAYARAEEKFQSLGPHLFHVVADPNRRIIPETEGKPERIWINRYRNPLYRADKFSLVQTFYSISGFVNSLNFNS